MIHRQTRRARPGSAFTLVELPAVSKGKRKAFTLVELLVVIAIIAVLTAILLPALNQVRQQARNVACASNQHQLALGIMMYVNQSGGWLPHTDMEGDYIYEGAGTYTNGYSFPDHYTGLGRLYEMNFIKGMGVFWCASEDMPSLEGGSGWGIKVFSRTPPTRTVTNYWFRCSASGSGPAPTNWPGQQSMKLSAIRRAPDDGLLMCAGGFGGGNFPLRIRWISLHNTTGFNLLFADGHVQWMSYKYYPKFPVTAVGQNGQTGTPSDTGKNRYRPDMGQLTLNRATEVYYGVWKYP